MLDDDEVDDQLDECECIDDEIDDDAAPLVAESRDAQLLLVEVDDEVDEDETQHLELLNIPTDETELDE